MVNTWMLKQLAQDVMLKQLAQDLMLKQLAQDVDIEDLSNHNSEIKDEYSVNSCLKIYRLMLRVTALVAWDVIKDFN